MIGPINWCYVPEPEQGGTSKGSFSAAPSKLKAGLLHSLYLAPFAVGVAFSLFALTSWFLASSSRFLNR